MSAYYGLADIGVAGMMTAGYHSGDLLVQVGPLYAPAVADLGVAGMMVAGIEETYTNIRQAQKGSIQISQQADGVSEASFTLKSTLADQPDDGALAVIAIGSLSDPLFAGYLDAPEEADGPGAKYLYRCRAQGLQKALRKRLIAERYTEQYAGDIVEDIITTYAPQFRADLYVSQGIFLDEIAFDYVTPLDACKELATRCNYVFYVAPDRYVHFGRDTTDSAPWDITDTTDYKDLLITPDSTQLINCVLVLYSELETRTHKFTGDGETEVFTLPRVPYTISAMDVDGVPVTFGTRYQEANESNDFSWNQTTGEIHTQAHPILAAGEELNVTYTARIPALLIVNDAESQTARQTTEGGDGIYDQFYDEQDNIYSQSDARAKAEGILAQYADPLVSASYAVTNDIFDFETNRLRVGQQQAITARGRDHTLTVSRITLSVAGFETETSLMKLRQDVELGPVNNGLETIFQELAARSAPVTPEYVTEVNIS